MVITIGKFDTLHIGHKKLIEEVLRESERLKKESCVLTFKQDSLAFLTVDEKKEILKSWGIDRIEFLDFDKIKDKSADEFIKKILKAKLKGSLVVVGEDFRFAKNREGTIDDLRRYFDVKVVKLEKKDKKVIKSQHIKELVKEGCVFEAFPLLGYFYFIWGEVIKGKGKGKKIGYSTANIKICGDKFLPKFGVYAVFCYLGDKRYEGVASLGHAFVRHNLPLLEVHLFDFDENILKRRIKVEFLKYLRGILKFKELSSLKEQIKKDIEDARAIFSSKIWTL